MMNWTKSVLLASAFCGALHDGMAEASVVQGLLRHANAHPAGEVAYSFDQSSWKGDIRSLPVGVFDSGVGGLTVLESLLTVDAYHNDRYTPGADGRPDLEKERFIYFGDKANMPYGNYDAAGRLDFLRELVLKDAIFLLGSRWRENASAKPRRDKPPVKAVVIACNTATAAGLEDIRMAFREWNLPVVVVGVVEAGATGVLDARRKKDTGGTVAVLATVGTCRSGAYPRLIQQAMGQAGRPSLPVIQQGSARLAGIIEGDPAFQQDSLTAVVREDVKALLDGPSDGKKAPPLDLVVLGCTHFPLVRDEIDEAMEYWRNWESKPGLRPYFERVAEKREFVDPAEWTARELFRHLAASRLLSDGKKAVTDKVPAFFVSVPHPKLQAEALTPDASGLSTEYKYGRKPGRLDLEDTVNVPMVPGDLPSHLQKLVQRRLPAVWKRMGSTTP